MMCRRYLQNCLFRNTGEVSKQQCILQQLCIVRMTADVPSIDHKRQYIRSFSQTRKVHCYSYSDFNICTRNLSSRNVNVNSVHVSYPQLLKTLNHRSSRHFHSPFCDSHLPKVFSKNNTFQLQNTYSLHSLVRKPNILNSQCNKTLNELHRDFSLSPKYILDASPTSVQPYLRLIRFDKPIGTWLLYWPCTWSIALAASPGCLPDFYLLTLFGMGSFFMRGAGCIINDMWDKDYDRKVERTKLRPLASGELTQFQGLLCLAGMLSVSLSILLQLNVYSIILGASSMLLVILYPLAKRYTYWPQAMLGITLNWGVLLAWSALHGSLEWPVIPLYIGCVFYTMTYDSIYAHQDKYDDLLIGVKSTALKFGDNTKPWLAGFASIMISGTTLTGYMSEQTWPFYAGLAVTAAHLIHQIYTVDLNDADDCARKFRSNSGIGVVLFLAIVAGTLLKKPAGNKEETKLLQTAS